MQEMFEDIKAHVADWEDEEELKKYLTGILDGQAFDHAGLIYGMGHAVYTLSDPRAVILKDYARRLSVEKIWRKNSDCMKRWSASAERALPEKEDF